VRRTKSRFGARLEPLSHVELMLHQGSGELQTVTGADLRASHHESREDPYRLAVGLIGAEAMLRLFTEQEANERAFTALTRFLDRLDGAPSRAAEPGKSVQPALDPLVLSFQLKLLWVSGYLPHLESCVECGAVEGLVGYLPAAGGAVCRNCGPGSIQLSPAGIRAIQTLVATPMAAAGEAGLNEGLAREALAIVRASYEHQGGFRLRTLA
jgi:DNA repair protein RecO (recombination protein O)